MKKLLLILIIISLGSTVLAGDLFKNQEVKNTSIALFSTCADKPSMDNTICAQKMASVVSVLYSEGLPNLASVFGKACFNICMQPALLPYYIQVIDEK